MGVELISKRYRNLNTLFYTDDLVGNVGDRFRLELEVKTSISVDTSETELYKFTSTQISAPNYNFLAGGFRVGDEINVRTDSLTSGTLTNAGIYTITGITETTITVNTSINFWYDPANEFLTVLALPQNLTTGGYQYLKGLTTSLNFVETNNPGNTSSVIDGENILVTFEDLTNIFGGSNSDGNQVGNKSGAYIESSKVFDLSNSLNTVFKQYRIEIIFILTGAYRPDLFELGNTLNPYIEINLSREPLATNNLFTLPILEVGNLGYFNEPYNIGSQTFNVIDSINELDYQTGGSYDFSIESTIPGTGPSPVPWGFGAMYISTSASYYKNKPETQSELSMVIPTSTINITASSSLNPDGAGYDLQIINQNTVGNVFSGTLVFTPNPEFNVFMQGREDGDRRLVVWVKINDVNIVIADVQADIIPTVAGPFILTSTKFFDHSQNVNEYLPSANELSYEANIEDDLAFLCKFDLAFNTKLTSIQGEIVAYNIVTEDEFTLQNVTFDTEGIPVIGGKYVFNESNTVFSQLPNTSVKEVATLKLDPANDTATTYGAVFYLPFIYRWEYWIAQLNANNDFYPDNQNKNWVPYGTTGNWRLRVKMSKVEGLLEYINRIALDIKDYDSNPDITQSLEIIRVSDGNTINVVLANEDQLVKGRHILTNGGTWDQASVWGQITIEPTESNPRYISSTILPFDNDVNNPLTPISGLYATLTFPSPDTALIECNLDPTKMDISDGCKITTKIKGCAINSQVTKVTTNDEIKVTTSDDIKILS